MLYRVLNMPLGTNAGVVFLFFKKKTQTMQTVSVEVHRVPGTPDLSRILGNMEKKSLVSEPVLYNKG